MNVAGFTNIGERLEFIASAHPQRIALQTDLNTITYEAFNARVNQVAHAVHARVKKPGDRVGLLFDQGEDAIVSIFGVLKAGAAFVPLDASQPQAKLAEICGSSSPVLLLSNADRIAEAALLCNSTIEVLDVHTLVDSADIGNPGFEVGSDTLAYLFFTSGSTGNPKGVSQSQRNLYHFVSSYCKTLGVEYTDKLSLLYSMGFSASNMDVFGALLNGATLCPYDIRKKGTAGIADWIDQRKISILHAVPTVFRHIAATLPDGRKLSTVRGLDLGGEAVYRSDLEIFKAHLNTDCVAVNHLAATEASVIAQHVIDFSREDYPEMLPVGAAADGVEIRLVDSEGNQVAKGEHGEIVLRSRYLSPGYWDAPDLNSKSFRVVDEAEGLRDYTSGDLGYITTEGWLYFLGRKDHRVKIRGFSVDTSEIDSALSRLEAVREVAVVARSLKDNAPIELAAFIVLKTGESLDLTALRQLLSEKLASYMIPSEFIVLSELPVNASGKVDRKALSASKLREVHDSDTFDAPESDLELQVAALMESLLEVEAVSRATDFFMIGGDSLRATELHAAIESNCGVRISLNLLFQTPTVAGIAANIERAKQGEAAEQADSFGRLIPLRASADGMHPILFLMHGDKGLAYVSPHFLSILGDQQPVYAFQASGLTPPDQVGWTIERMATGYIEAMREVQPEGPYFMASICAGCMVTLEMQRQLVDSGDLVAPLLLIDPPMNPPGERDWFRRKKRDFKYFCKRVFGARSFEARYQKKMQKHGDNGRMKIDPTDQAAVRNAMLVTHGFRQALGAHRMVPTSHTVLLLGSQIRLSRKDGKLRKKLLGDVQFFDVGKRHSDVHAVGNEQFSQALEGAQKTAIEFIKASAQ